MLVHHHARLLAAPLRHLVRHVLVAGTSAARCDAPVGAGTREDGGTRGALEDGGTSGALEAGATTDALEDGISSAAGN